MNYSDLTNLEPGDKIKRIGIVLLGIFELTQGEVYTFDRYEYHDNHSIRGLYVKESPYFSNLDKWERVLPIILLPDSLFEVE